jgi:hypothetical protein
MRRRSFIRQLAIIGGLISVIAAVIIGFSLYWVTGPGYYGELNAMCAQLQRIPQVKIIELQGNHDLTLEDIWAKIHVVGKGDMRFSDLGIDAFHRTNHLHLGAVGPYSIRVEGEGFHGVVETATNKPVRSKFWGYSVDIGPEGPFASMFPFKIPNVQTAIKHYDDIQRIIGEWPTESSKRYVRDSQGTDVYYYIETKKAPKDSAKQGS